MRRGRGSLLFVSPGVAAALFAQGLLVVGNRAEEASAPPDKPAAAPAKEFRKFKDRTVGYNLEVPKTWQFDQPKLKKLGGIRMVSPFARIAFCA